MLTNAKHHDNVSRNAERERGKRAKVACLRATKVTLALTATKAFDSGVVVHHYRPALGEPVG